VRYEQDVRPLNSVKGLRRRAAGGENDHQIPPDNPNGGMIVLKSRIWKGMHQVVLALAVFRV
jgi:hypothetical protein